MPTDVKAQVADLLNKVDTTALVARPLSDWRPILAEECQVYVFGENYLAKRFDQINYKFCEKNEAKEILVDNLYALLRFKYFPKTSEEIDERINKIVSSFTANLKTTLKKVSFDVASENVISMLPDYCVAFRNGVYNFKDDEWLFKYDIIHLKQLSNTIYMYTREYAIMWYLDYDFESLGIKISDVSLKDFINVMKSITSNKSTRNYCFELLYNIAHNAVDEFSMSRFEHLCEILGYSILQSFSQYFVLLIGSGQNGKNSLFDGCFTNRLVPRPASNDLDAIETDKFITGALENRSHNIFLETSAKTYTESKMIKALTGSMYQTIEPKGVNKYSGIINCKYIFAGNDQDKIKFADTTTGFRRRINMFEITYHWDAQKRFLKKGDYFDASFSDSLSELKDDVANTTAYVYFAMYGIMRATCNFKKNFQFTMNDWSQKYTDIDEELRLKIDNITRKDIYAFMTQSKTQLDSCKALFFDSRKNRLYMSQTIKNLGYKTYEDMVNMIADDEAFISYFSEHDVYMSVRMLQQMIGNISSPTTFTQTLKKTYNINTLETLHANKPYVKCTFLNNKLRILS